MRCFVSAEIPDSLKEKIVEIQKNFKNNGVRLTEPENLHFTLKFLGEITEQKAAEAAKKLSELKENPFSVIVKGIGAFPNERFPHILWVGCESTELEALAREIDRKMGEIGFPSEKNYKSHITIARIKYDQQWLPEKLEQLSDIEVGALNISEICLKKSILTKRGPIYNDIMRVPLGF